MALADAVDSAYPFDFTQLPSACRIIMGYVGRDGYTPHVWTLGEVQAARVTGRQWWPIGVGISGGATNARDGHDLASVMIARLPNYGVTKTTPVFQDLEPDALRADAAGAQACVAAWKADMHAAGYPHAYTYSLDAPFIDWVANWTNVRPTQLPLGKIGWQYGGAQSPPAYDVSVFDSALLSYAGGDMPLNDDDKDWITTTVTQIVDERIRAHLGASAVNAPTSVLNTGISKRLGMDRRADLNAIPTAAENAAAVVASLPPASGGPPPPYEGLVRLEPAPVTPPTPSPASE